MGAQKKKVIITKKFWPLFMDGLQLSQGYRAPTKIQFAFLLFSYPELPTTQLINHGRMKD